MLAFLKDCEKGFTDAFKANNIIYMDIALVNLAAAPRQMLAEVACKGGHHRFSHTAPHARNNSHVGDKSQSEFEPERKPHA
eukprot:1160114-Pelagomonas_calceolata.AAC.10